MDPSHTEGCTLRIQGTHLSHLTFWWSPWKRKFTVTHLGCLMNPNCWIRTMSILVTAHGRRSALTACSLGVKMWVGFLDLRGLLPPSLAYSTDIYVTPTMWLVVIIQTWNGLRRVSIQEKNWIHRLIEYVPQQKCLEGPVGHTKESVLVYYKKLCNKCANVLNIFPLILIYENF